MEITNFTNCAKKWRAIFQNEKPEMYWQDGFLVNSWCERCQLCCGAQAPNDVPYPMRLLRSQQKPEILGKLHLLDQQTAVIDQRGCKAAAPTGCLLSREQRPIACSLFPLSIHKGVLYIYKNCPSVFMSTLDQLLILGETAAQDLRKRYTQTELESIDANINHELMLAKFVCLGLQLFEPEI